MQSLDVISINIWQIVISLCNLVLLFLILKKLLYKPVRAFIAKRQEALDAQYAAADEAKASAESDKALYASKLRSAQDEADALLRNAASNADQLSAKTLAEAREKATGIISRAKNEAELEKKKAEAEIRNQIIDVSAQLTEKLIGREINQKDHHSLIDSFLNEIGEGDDANQ